MKERLIIITVAIIAGLFITSAGFLIYQSTKNMGSDATAKKTSLSPTPIAGKTISLKVTEPADESITNKRTIQIKGTTDPENIIVASTNQQDVTGKPTQDGNFTITVEIDAGANLIYTRSISPNGDSAEDKRTITYSTEDF